MTKKWRGKNIYWYRYGVVFLRADNPKIKTYV